MRFQKHKEIVVMILTFRTFGDIWVSRGGPTQCALPSFFFFSFFSSVRMLRGYLAPNGKPRETRGVFSSGPPGEEDLIFIKNREAYAPSSRDCTSSVCSSEADHTQARRSEKDSSSCLLRPAVCVLRLCRYGGIPVPKMSRTSLVSATTATLVLLAGQPVGCGMSSFCVSPEEAYLHCE